MNWFQRYGIPGAYFLGLTIAWTYALYYCTIPTVDFKMLVAAAAITFIPIGYIISVFQQLLYLSCKCLGIHRAAKRKAGVDFPGLSDDEPTIEADSLLLIITRKRIPLDDHRFVQDWIRRRMDVIAIDSSLIVATIFSLIIGFLIPIVYFRWSPQFAIFRVGPPFVISIFVVLVMYLSAKILRGQIIKVIAAMYEKYK